ncbi:MAG: alanine racemase [Acidobacteria bacterium]|nr:MAG: alanine racemase [Acidobacteriota bacterium]
MHSIREPRPGTTVIRPTVATVSADALKQNLRAVKRLLRPSGVQRPASSVPDPGTLDVGRRTTDGPGVIAVVKANAYGHGAVEAARAFEAAGADMLACADIEEGVELRQAGIRAPILVFGALSVSDLDGLFDHRLTPTVSTPGAATRLEAAAERRGVVLECHLKIDTGMNRLGFRHDNLARTLPDLVKSRHLKISAVYSHAATADDPESLFLDEQRGAFDRAMAALGAMGLRGARRHFANSAATLRDSRTWYDWVRPGLILYGVVPPPLHAADLELGPALSLSSRIVAVKGVRPGESVGYGRKWTADQARSVAVVPAGYADGLDTRLGNKGVALVRGRRVPIVGAISMDMLTIDVSGLTVSPGDEVVLIGRQGGEEITAREMAATIGAIPWEVLCRLGSRIAREYS